MKRIVAVFISVIILITAVPLAGLAGLEIAPKAAAYSVGDTIQFGTYPQSEVKDSSLIARLNATNTQWVSYQYYSGTGSWADGGMNPSDYMMYRDAVVDGIKYRAVKIDEYRPYFTGGTFQEETNRFQMQHGYLTDEIYWFRFDPIVWRVLNPQTGLIMSETILDSQAFNNFVIGTKETASWGEYITRPYYGNSGESYYAADYSKSSINKWLDGSFFNTAFNESQKTNIELTHLDYGREVEFDTPESDAKIFLLSIHDVANSAYGFSDSDGTKDLARRGKGSDYAKCQGLYVEGIGDFSGYSNWLLRSHVSNNEAYRVIENGLLYHYYDSHKNQVGACSDGIRPACRLKELKNDTSQADTLLPEVEGNNRLIQFGTYPQTKVSETTALNNAANAAVWKSYGYYTGTGLRDDGWMTPSDYMQFADFFCNGEKYRAVKFTQYRPFYSGDKSKASNSLQDENGYTPDNVYYFKYEPLIWRVLNPSEGYIICESLIDSQAYQNTVYLNSDGYYQSIESSIYANDYATSSIRTWLNYDFYETAFTVDQKANIKTTALNNVAYSTDFAQFNSAATNDKIFLLSYADALNTSYGFSSSFTDDAARQAQGTDYAKCQGLTVSTSPVDFGHSYWWLRSPSFKSNYVCEVGESGYALSYYIVSCTSIGVRPACYVSLLKDDTEVSTNLFSEAENPSDPGNPNNSEEEKKIAVFSTEHSLSVRTGETIDLGFGILQGDTLDEEWRRMAIVVSDPTVISLSNYTKVDYGYSLEIRGKKAGSSNLTISDTELGISTSVIINVYDGFVRTYSYKIDSLPKFYPNNIFERNIETNIYNLNDLYINNYTCTRKGSSYEVSFNAFNSKYHTAAVDIFDKDGEWIGCKEIKKYSDISSLWDTGEQTYYLITDAFSGKLLTYEQASFSKRNEVSFTVPEGGYFTISNNFAESIGCFLFNSLEILYTGVSTVIDSLTADSVKVSEFSDLIVKEIKDNPETRKEIKKIFIKAADKEIRDYTKKILAGDIENAYASLSGLLENILDSLDISWKHAFKSVTGVGESVFEYFAGPAGIALKGMFAISKNSSAMLQAVHLAKSTDEAYIAVYSDDDININPYGVSVITDGNIDNEAVLQVFKVTTDDSIRVVLNSDDPMEDYETYNICFVKNDTTVQPNGRVKVSIPIPDGMKGDTCVIYRQEEDGSWLIIDAHVEGNYLVFETTHFSLYTIVGKIANMRISSNPQKMEYMLGDTLVTDGLQLECNGKFIDAGYLCSPTVLSEVGTERISVKYGHAETSFNIVVKKAVHEHQYNATITNEPTCSEDGETTYTCSICGNTYTEPISATGDHVDDNNDGHCDTCEQQMTGGKHCKYCGKIHNGLFGWLVKFFHSILAIFKR